MIIHGCWKWGSTPIESKLNLILSLQNLGSKDLQISATKNLAHPTEKGFWDFFKLPFFCKLSSWCLVFDGRYGNLASAKYSNQLLCLLTFHCNHYSLIVIVLCGIDPISTGNLALWKVLFSYHFGKACSSAFSSSSTSSMAFPRGHQMRCMMLLHFDFTEFSGKIFLHCLSILCNFGK